MEQITERHAVSRVKNEEKEDMIRIGDLILENYRIYRDLGEGTYGKVKLALDYSKDKMVALKFVKKSKLKKQSQIERVKFESKLMSILDHPAICKINKTIETFEYFILEMEYIKGEELYGYMRNKKNMSESKAKDIFCQILDGLNYLHENRIVHRDLKPENIMIDENGCVKIIDFGFATIYRFDALCTTHCGSPYYASPEMVKGHPYMGPEVDIWSLGVILYAMTHGILPFEGKSINEVYANIAQGEYTVSCLLSKPLQDLIKKMICINLKKRATLEDIYLHPWIKKVYMFINHNCIKNIENVILFKLIEMQFDIKNLRHNLTDNLSPETSFYNLIQSKIKNIKEFQTICNILSEKEFIDMVNYNKICEKRKNALENHKFHSKMLSNHEQLELKLRSNRLSYTETVNHKFDTTINKLYECLISNHYKFYQQKHLFTVLISNKQSLLFEIMCEAFTSKSCRVNFILQYGNSKLLKNYIFEIMKSLHSY
ncbi:hypothetical protein GVAV_003364 [Gurleya vavrai]